MAKKKPAAKMKSAKRKPVKKKPAARKQHREASPKKALPKKASPEREDETTERTPAKSKQIDRWLQALERRVGGLPADYTRFIREGNFSRVPGPGGVSFAALEPTPFGSGVLEFFLDPNPNEMGYFDDVNMLVIGSNGFDYPTCMSLRKEDRGSIYYYDHEQRALWEDKQFHMMFANLAPTIVKYLADRRAGKVPSKPEGLESFFKIADSFTAFLERCEPMETDEGS